MDEQAIGYDMWIFLTTTQAKILGACFLFGALGGVIAHFINNEKQGRSKEGEASWFLYPSFWRSGVIGSGGAIGFLFFLIAVGGIGAFNDKSEHLRVISVSVIAGFGARSLLPRMVGHLERQIESASAKAEEAQDSAERALDEARYGLKEAKRRIEQGQISTLLVAASRPSAPLNEWRDILERAQELINAGSALPAIWINVARVKRRHIGAQEAIETLDTAIGLFESGALERDPNYPNAYYNRACYSEQVYLEKGDVAARKMALRDIETCLGLAANKKSEVEQMLGDEDLTALVATEEFQAIARRYTN